MYKPGMIVHSGGLPTLVVWVGTGDEYKAGGSKVSDFLFKQGYAGTSWSDGDRSVLAVHLINKAGFEAEQERDAVCRHIMEAVQAALAGTGITPEGPNGSDAPYELRRFVKGKGWAKYTVLVACGTRVEEAEFVRNEHGWYCDRIGWEFTWNYPIPDGGPERDGSQPPAQSPREAAMNLLQKKGCGKLYFRVLLDDFPPFE